MRTALLVASALTIACSNPPDVRSPAEAAETDAGGRVEPSTPQEQDLLRKMDGLKVGVEVTLNKQSVMLEPAYTAASGLRCRRVRFVSPDKTSRLVCKDQNGWFFALAIDGASDTPSSVNPPQEVEVAPTGEAVAISPKNRTGSDLGGAPSGEHP